ncbi:MAG: DNA topoisomerase IB [Pseudomonadota bacterium]
MSVEICSTLGLRHYPDTNPGIRRLRRGRGFSYVAPEGEPILCQQERARLTALGVPPAYSDVWMSPFPDGFILATGRDAAARKQYRYHPDWTAYQAAQKFARLPQLARGLPRLRRWIGARLAEDRTEEDHALATALALMDRLSLRVGCPNYTRDNGSYGATTLRRAHLITGEGPARLRFRAKGGARVEKPVTGARLLVQLERGAAARSGPLVQWRDASGRARRVTAPKVAARMSDLVGADVSPKDLRTWNGTHAAFVAAVEGTAPTVKSITTAAAHRLHNTAAIARKSYVHPDLIDAVKRHRDIGAPLTPPGPFLRKGEAELADWLVAAG